MRHRKDQGMPPLFLMRGIRISCGNSQGKGQTKRRRNGKFLCGGKKKREVRRQKRMEAKTFSKAKGNWKELLGVLLAVRKIRGIFEITTTNCMM